MSTSFTGVGPEPGPRAVYLDSAGISCQGQCAKSRESLDRVVFIYQFGVPSSHCIASPTEIDLKLRRLCRSITHLTCRFFLTRETFERTLNLALILDGLARIAILVWDPNFMCLGMCFARRAMHEIISVVV